MKNFKNFIIFLLIFISNNKAQTGWLDILCCCTSAKTTRKKDTTSSTNSLKRNNSSTPKTIVTNSGNSTARRNNSKPSSSENNKDRYKTLQAYINSEDSDSSQAKFINDPATQEFQEATKQKTTKNDQSIVNNAFQERSINDQVRQQTQEATDHNRPSATPTIIAPINKNSFMQHSSIRENSFNQQLSHSYRDSLISNENSISNNKPAEATSNPYVHNPNMFTDAQNQESFLPHVPVVNSSSNMSQQNQNTLIQNPVVPSNKSNFDHVSAAEINRLNIVFSHSSTPKDNAWTNKARRAKSSESPQSESPQSESPQDYNF